MIEIITAIGESNLSISLDEKSLLFNHIYLVANDIIRYQREALVNVIPHFMNLLQQLLQYDINDLTY